jgi:hypothetical protein
MTLMVKLGGPRKFKDNKDGGAASVPIAIKKGNQGGGNKGEEKQ